MKRDMDLIRQIAFVVEEKAHGFADTLQSDEIAIEGFDEKQIAYHCELMSEGELFLSSDFTGIESDFRTFLITRLTVKGHDFLDAARNEGIWKKATGVIANQIGGVSIDVLIKYLKSLAMDQLGLSRGAGSGP